MTCLFSDAWWTGTASVAWQFGVVVLILKRGNGKCVPTIVDALISLPSKVYFRELEGRLQSIVVPQIQEKCGFHPGPG